MKSIKFAGKLIIVLWIYYTSYNTYFGWNFHPQSELEITMDEIFYKGMCISILIYFSPLLYAYEQWVKSQEQNKNQ